MQSTSTLPVAFGCFKLSPDKNTVHCADVIAGDQMRTIDSLKTSYHESRTCVWEKFVKKDDLEKVNNWINNQ